MSDELVRVLNLIASEFETIGDRGYHEAEPSKKLSRTFVVHHIRGIVESYKLAQEAVEAVQREAQS